VTAPPVECIDLVRTFGDVRAVDGVNLVVEEGEIFGFLGPNGAGKSTAVRILVTLLAQTSGVARVAGFDVATQAHEIRRRIGVALQDAAIDPIMTGTELLNLQAVLHGLPTDLARRRGGELLERVGLSAAADRRVGTYSGGMRRRLDLALALVHEPSVLFLDEPTTGLDPTSRQSLWEELRWLNSERGTTVFLTTQYLEEADFLAQRVAIIDGGKIVEEGTPAQLKADVGDPTLFIELGQGADESAVVDVLGSFGTSTPAKRGSVGVRLPGGATKLPAVVRALDDKGLAVAAMNLAQPSLDDVFAKATGRRLEGASADGDDSSPPAKKGRKR